MNLFHALVDTAAYQKVFEDSWKFYFIRYCSNSKKCSKVSHKARGGKIGNTHLSWLEMASKMKVALHHATSKTLFVLGNLDYRVLMDRLGHLLVGLNVINKLLIILGLVCLIR
jgi:hypothetical protein